MTPKQSAKPVDQRAAKRARFAAEKQRGAVSEPGRRGASPMVLVAGLVIVVAVIAILIALPGRAPAAPAVQAATGGQAPNVQPAGVQSSSGQSNSAAAPQQAAAQPVPVQAATLGHDPYPLVAAQDGAVRLPMSTFDDYQAHFYTYLVNGQPIEFFVVKSKEGTVRAAFNACDVCFSAKRGYLQQGDMMVCQNCGSRFPTDQINVVRGGCNPSPLDRQVVGDTLIILESDLAQGVQFF